MQDKEDEDDGNEGKTTSGEETNRTDEDTKRDDDASNGEEDVDWYAVRGGVGYEADKWDSGGSDGDKNKELLEEKETEEATEDEDI